MNDTNGLLDSVTNAFVPIHRDGYKFVAIAALIALALFVIAPPLGWVGVIATACCAYFFRDPERVAPQRQGVVVSPADGKIAAIAEISPPRELALGDAKLTVMAGGDRRQYRVIAPCWSPPYAPCHRDGPRRTDLRCHENRARTMRRPVPVPANLEGSQSRTRCGPCPVRTTRSGRSPALGVRINAGRSDTGSSR